MRTQHIRYNLTLICSVLFFQLGCTDRNTNLDKMTLRQLSAQSRQAVIASDKKSKEIDSINQKLRASSAQAKIILDETKRHRP